MDYFDFPLDPPDAGNMSRGRDFNVYRERYNGIHTGEDWWYAGGSSLGMPVYSIGYGQVSYAHTNGWGRDLGTLVIRHVMQSGQTIYSFYGHLDPDSLDLRLGDCVSRGQVVGLIGDPKSSPHLHFEVHSVFADQPGPGYWSTDPIRAGWFPPSQTIEDSRLAISPGLAWWHTFQADRVRYLGQLENNLALIEVDDQLLAFDLIEGVGLVRTEITGLHSYSLWDADRPWLVTGDMSGRIMTWHLRFENDPDDPRLTLTPVWQIETHHIGGLEPIPLPNNWLALVQGTSLTALDPSGNIAWQAELNGRLQGWGRFDPQASERDWLVLGKGHATPALYTTLAELGYLQTDELLTYRQFGTRLQGHPDRTRLPAVQVTTGHIGHGLSIAAGLALGMKLDGLDQNVYVVLGDGDQHEGQTWEAVMFASHYNLHNLVAILDLNQLTPTWACERNHGFRDSRR